MSLPETENIEEILVTSSPVLDVRAPCEFLTSHLPNSVNIAILNDEERSAVGTCYQNDGKEAAIELGHKLISGSLKEQRIESWKSFAENTPDGAICCLRGGLRSTIAQRWLADAGYVLPRVSGGYKRMRRFLLDGLPSWVDEIPLVVIAGHTGSGKTTLLHRLQTSGRRILDLEGLANHRGSAFGDNLSEQPSQASFENVVGTSLLRLARVGGESNAVFVESESLAIGKVKQPKILHEKLQVAPVIVVEVPFDIRVQNIAEDYVAGLAEDCDASSPEEISQFLYNHLEQGLIRISKRLGLERFNKVRRLLGEAMELYGRDRDLAVHGRWIEPLLRDYYDLFYESHIKGYGNRIIFRGSPDEILKLSCKKLELCSVANTDASWPQVSRSAPAHNNFLFR